MNLFHFQPLKIKIDRLLLLITYNKHKMFKQNYLKELPEDIIIKIYKSVYQHSLKAVEKLDVKYYEDLYMFLDGNEEFYGAEIIKKTAFYEFHHICKDIKRREDEFNYIYLNRKALLKNIEDLNIRQIRFHIPKLQVGNKKFRKFMETLRNSVPDRFDEFNICATYGGAYGVAIVKELVIKQRFVFKFKECFKNFAQLEKVCIECEKYLGDMLYETAFDIEGDMEGELTINTTNFLNQNVFKRCYFSSWENADGIYVNGECRPVFID